MLMLRIFAFLTIDDGAKLLKINLLESSVNEDDLSISG